MQCTKYYYVEMIALIMGVK